jgi:predicted MPP superfamily phosphohydrolase
MTTRGFRALVMPDSPQRRSERLAAIALPALFLGTNAVFIVLLYFRTLHTDIVIRLLYDVNTLLFPPLFLVYAARRIFMRAPRRRRSLVWAALAVLLVSLRVYATHIEPHLLQVHEVTIHSDKVTKSFTLLHLSDIQSGGIGAYEEKVFARIRDLNPDLIVHTGDLLQPQGGATRKSELPKLAALFATLNPPLGMYTVEGESDTGLTNIPPQSLGGLRFLNSEAVGIRAKGYHIRLLGLAHAHSFRHGAVPGAEVSRWLAESPPDALNIVMGHRPDYLTRLTNQPIDLCLAGHTHGGQVRLPWIGALATSSNAPREWSRGFREVGRTRLNVSAGIGASHNKGLPSIRINCPPEMTLIRFVPEGA